ncbi:MAG: S8 family serine peptidase, partial [Arenimonas sp.]
MLGKCGGTSSDIDDAIVWASGGTVAGVPANLTPAKVINLSLGGPGSCLASTQAAIDAANANGATVIIAAGNDNSDASGFQPASCTNTLVVGAMGRTGARASYSNFGPIVDIAAPGGDGGNPVASTLNSGTTVPSTESYAGYQGTSMATPHVAGVAALVQAFSAGVFTSAQMESLLKVTSRSQPVPCLPGCGVGMLDAHAALLGSANAVLNITDPVDVLEGNSGTHTLTFTVNLSKPVGTSVTFNIATANGTATAGSDYVAKTANAQVITAGQTSKTFVVTVNGDGTGEDDETFFANLTGVTGPVSVIDDQGLAQIVNDDVLALLDGVPVTGLAGATGSQRVYQMTVPAGATNLVLQTSGGTGDMDLYVRFGTPPTLDTFDCRPFTSSNDESCPFPTPQAGIWYVMLDGFEAYSGMTLSGNYDVPAPTTNLTINDVSVNEGDSGTKLMTFTASLSAATTVPVTFNATTVDGTALGGPDFVSQVNVPLSIPAGQTSKTFSVSIKGETTVEPLETLFVNLSNVAGANLTDAQGIGYIINNDGALISINDVAVGEGASGTKVMTFTVSLSQVAPGPVTYRISSLNATAIAPTDYVAFDLTNQTIAQGQLSKTHSVTINGDATVEDTEVFFVNVRQPTGASVWDGQGIGYIINNDGALISINDVAVGEGASGTKVMTFTVSLSQ